MRPANIITAIADILLGFAASGAFALLVFDSEQIATFLLLSDLGWLILSTIGLYGGGVVFNDVFDAELDKVERPERPIPSGSASLRGAAIFGSLLFLLGIFSAWRVNMYSAYIAMAIAALALAYDAFNKHHAFLGPLNMGACRGGNVLLGVSILPGTLIDLWFLSLIPILYIGAITMISQGEVHGGNKNNIKLAFVLYFIVILIIVSLEALPSYTFWHALPFLLFFIYLVLPPLFQAFKQPIPAKIKKAVKAGIIALIVLDATIASGFADWQFGLLVLILLPISMFLGKKFAVT
jgi:4-hydroxybenzoate polyprenyltransferase